MSRWLDDDEMHQRIKDRYYDDFDDDIPPPAWYSSGVRMHKQRGKERMMQAELREAIERKTKEYKEGLPEIIRKAAEADSEGPYGSAISLYFSGAVDYLREEFPSEEVNKLAEMIWNLVGHRVIRMTVGDIESPAFTLTGPSLDHIHAEIILPNDWVRKLKTDPIVQLCAIAFCGSQAVDYWSDILLDDRRATQVRANIWETEVMTAMMKKHPGWKPHGRGAHILEHFPEGLASENAQEFLYEWKPWPEEVIN